MKKFNLCACIGRLQDDLDGHIFTLCPCLAHNMGPKERAKFNAYQERHAEETKKALEQVFIP